MEKIAFIGTGVMGAPMAGHLVAAGYAVNGYRRNYDALVTCSKQYGFSPCRSVDEALLDVQVVISMVAMPSDVDEVFDAVFCKVKAGTLAINMSTSSPEQAQRLHNAGKQKGVAVLDAPVTGSDVGAKNGTLSIMVGGDEADYKRALPILSAMGSRVTYMGVAGNGQHTKACNQICVAGSTAAYSEAIVYARSVGLDVEKVRQVVGGGAGGSWQIENMYPRVQRGDFAPGFFIKHFIKDMRIVKGEAEKRGLHLNALNTILAMYEELAQRGMGDLGTQALLKVYDDNK